MLPRPDTIRPRRWPWFAGALVIVLIAVGIPATARFAHWRSSLHPLVAYPGYWVSTPVDLGQTQYFGSNAVTQQVITHPNDLAEVALGVSSVHPVVSQNTADADITVLRCVLAHDGPGPVAVGARAAAAICADLTRFVSGPVTLGFSKGNDDIVVAVTPTTLAE